MTTLLAEDKKVTRKRIQLQRTATHPGQRIEGLAKIGLIGREIDPSVGEKAQHLGRILRMDRKIEGSKLGAVEGPNRMGQHFPARRQNSPRLTACRARERRPDCFGRRWNGWAAVTILEE